VRCFSLVSLALVAMAVIGCGDSGEVKPEDSMAPILEKARKDQGITTTEITPKDKIGKAPDATAKPAGSDKSGDKGASASTGK
jgi:hypothetical protein